MTTNATTGTTPPKKLNDVMCDMYELRCLSVTIHEMANILKRNYFKTIPVKLGDKSEFVNDFYTMNELINAIWDYSNKIKQQLDSVENRIVEIRNVMGEEENQ